MPPRGRHYNALARLWQGLVVPNRSFYDGSTEAAVVLVKNGKLPCCNSLIAIFKLNVNLVAIERNQTIMNVCSVTKFY